MSVPEVDHFFDRTDSYGVYEVDVPCFRAVFPFLDLTVDEDVEGELARHETLLPVCLGTSRRYSTALEACLVADVGLVCLRRRYSSTGAAGNVVVKGMGPVV
jgi:hypothetical protein